MSDFSNAQKATASEIDCRRGKETQRYAGTSSRGVIASVGMLWKRFYCETQINEILQTTKYSGKWLVYGIMSIFYDVLNINLTYSLTTWQISSQPMQTELFEFFSHNKYFSETEERLQKISLSFLLWESNRIRKNLCWYEKNNRGSAIWS